MWRNTNESRRVPCQTTLNSCELFKTLRQNREGSYNERIPHLKYLERYGENGDFIFFSIFVDFVKSVIQICGENGVNVIRPGDNGGCDVIGSTKSSILSTQTNNERADKQ